MTSQPQPGDVILTRSKGWAGWLIRLGAALANSHAVHNHVIIAHHVDEAGTLWGIEGRPGGVGWVDCRPALASSWTLTNADQPKSAAQRAQIAEVVKGALGTPYDWQAIQADAMRALHIQVLWTRDFGQSAPAHVVCSSLADWGYQHVGLLSPNGDSSRYTTPGDWAQFITLRGWAA